MSKCLYITEKPSVAASFAEVLGMNITKMDRGRGYAENETSVISWCFGHLITLAFPDVYDPKFKEWKIEHLPIIPNKYIYTVIDDSGVKRQFDTIKALANRDDIDMIYACTDSGREGEYIYRLVYEHSGSTKSAKRVWISSFTDDSIKNGIKNALDISKYDSLSSSAYCRAKEDWLFGMNFSRIYTCQYGWKLNNLLEQKGKSVIAVGRVMTCVLGLVVERELEIRNFVPKKHYGITGQFKSEESLINYSGKWTPEKKDEKIDVNKDAKKDSKKDTKTEEEEKYISMEDAQKIMESLQGLPALIKKVDIKSKSEVAPLLFNLAELQSECTKKFKLAVHKTLEIAQSLYEKKLITYPRTDSRHLTTSIVPELPKILNGLSKNPTFKDSVLKIKEIGGVKITASTKRYVDDSKVTDHYAIIPTYMTTDMSRLDSDTRNVYSLIIKRFLAIFFPPAVFNTVRVETEVGKELFITNSKTLKDAGWKEVYDVSAKQDEETTDAPIHLLKKKEKCQVLDYSLDEKETKAPPRYTDGSLVITMEKAGKFIENEELREQIKTCGIGTSATRASIIKKLNDIGYMDINPKTQVVSTTKKGEAIVAVISRTAKELLSPSLSASWEKGLVMIEKNETTEEVFYDKLCSYITKTIQKVKNSSRFIDLNEIFNDNRSN